MIDITKLSRTYEVRRLADTDADEVLRLCRDNTLFYRYCEAKPTREQILEDMHIAPPGIEASQKYYVGLFLDHVLLAVMDLIDGYPSPEIAYIGLFMMDPRFQRKQLGSAIIREAEDYLRSIGKTAVRLAINKGNPQSTSFWKKNSYTVIREVTRNGWPLLEAEHLL